MANQIAQFMRVDWFWLHDNQVRIFSKKDALVLAFDCEEQKSATKLSNGFTYFLRSET